MPIDVWKAWPARTARDSRSSASGNCSSNRFSRFVRRFITNPIGSMAPMQAATGAAYGRATNTAVSSPTTADEITVTSIRPLGVVCTPDCSISRERPDPCRDSFTNLSTTGIGPSTIFWRTELSTTSPVESVNETSFRRRSSSRCAIMPGRAVMAKYEPTISATTNRKTISARPISGSP